MASQSLFEEESKGGVLNTSSNGVGDFTPEKKSGKKKMEDEEKKGDSALDRPLRERKSVERYAAMSTSRVSASKGLEIQQGSGEKLKDIPNVAFKLSKRKADESLRVLHRILFGKKANVYFLKRNILQFSGFVWSQNEEKDRLKLKEKLNKCHKDRLLDLSNLLDIYTLKVNTKKEDISARLMEFLESPRITREVLLSEKAKKGKKRKRGLRRTGKREVDEASSDKEKKGKKRQRREPVKDEEEDKDRVSSVDNDDESADGDEATDAEETSENSKNEEEDEEHKHNPDLAKKSSDEEEIDKLEEIESKKDSPLARKASSTTSKKATSSSKKKEYKESKSKISSESKAVVAKDTKRSSNMNKTSKKDLSSSKKKVDTEAEPKVSSERKTDSSKNTKRSAKPKEKVTIKTDSNDSSKRKVSMKSDISKEDDKNEGKSNVGAASEDQTGTKKECLKIESNNIEEGKKKDLSVVPTTEQLSTVLSEILKKVDFNVATLADIIKKLGAHFDTDLMYRKAEIKRILEEVINRMTDDEDAEDADEKGEKN